MSAAEPVASMTAGKSASASSPKSAPAASCRTNRSALRSTGSTCPPPAREQLTGGGEERASRQRGRAPLTGAGDKALLGTGSTCYLWLLFMQFGPGPN